MQLLNGTQLASTHRANIKQRLLARQQAGLPTASLAVILVGDNPSSAIYVKHKSRACAEVGISSQVITMPANTDIKTLLETIHACNNDPSIDGILLQLPLPEHLDSNKLLEQIHPNKDVDGFHPYNLGRLAQGQPAMRPCTPMGVMHLLAQTGEELLGKHAVIVGASNIVGRPMALELLAKDCTITVCHRFTQNLAQHINAADILIAAIGKPGVIDSTWIKPGAIVIDVGFTRDEHGKIHGDIDLETCTQASWITPVPGGVGPMTVASLLENTLQAAHINKPTD